MLWSDLSKKDKIIWCLCCFIILFVGMILGSIVESTIARYMVNSDTADVANTEFVPQKIAPYMTYFGEDNNSWHYYVDERTDVLYIVREQSNSFGITPAYNADHSLMTREQLINEQK